VRLAGIAALVAIAACGGVESDDSLGTVTPAAVVGTYQLVSVNGRAVPTAGLGAVLAGSIVLAADGRATRTIRHQLSGVAAERDFVSTGTFTATSDRVVFALIEDPARPGLVWRPDAALVDGVLTLRYPNPADGPEIVEVYHHSAAR
jgi:hypothetical protein